MTSFSCSLHLNSPQHHYCHFFNNDRYSDYKIRFTSSNRVIPVHKVVLSTSPYFEAVFDCKMKEQFENEMLIDSTQDDERVFCDMIRILYTRQITVYSFEELLLLMEMSDKYQCNELRKQCEEKVLEFLNIENCLMVWCFVELQVEKYNLLFKRVFHLIKNYYIVKYLNTNFNGHCHSHGHGSISPNSSAALAYNNNNPFVRHQQQGHQHHSKKYLCDDEEEKEDEILMNHLNFNSICKNGYEKEQFYEFISDLNLKQLKSFIDHFITRSCDFVKVNELIIYWYKKENERAQMLPELIEYITEIAKKQ
ncbi:hypothetical protein ABK040_009615 [Willaertia magna]